TQGDAVTAIRPGAAEISRVDKRRSCGIELRDEGIVAAANSSLKRIGQWKIYRAGPARHISLTTGVHSDPTADVLATAAKICVIDYRIHALGFWIQLRHKSVSSPAAEVRSETAGSGWSVTLRST